jgi:hypothetical protein
MVEQESHKKAQSTNEKIHYVHFVPSVAKKNVR